MTQYFVGLVAGLVMTTASGMAVAQQEFDTDPDILRVTVKNPTQDDWENVPVVLPAQEGKQYLAARSDGGEFVFVQSDDLDGDEKPDEMVFPASLKAGESKTFELSSGQAMRMAVKPMAHTGMYTKTEERRGFEGPGWESDLVAFRLYWDKRNASDVFCKTTSTLSLENFARTDVDYHQLTPWGMDVLKVKTAVGIGGFGAWIDGKVEKVADAKREYKVISNGPHRAVCDFVYTDWKAGGRTLELTARMKICGGQDYADCDLFVKATDGKPLPEMLAGFVKHTSETELLKDDSVVMVGRWGNQALGEGEVPMGGNLGLSIMAEPQEVVRIEEDDVNHLIILKPDEKASFRYFVDWYKDPQPAKNAQEFGEMMRQVARKRPMVTVEKAL